MSELQENEQYRIQMATITCAALGYWKEEDGIPAEYDTPALRDVAKLYAKYEALRKQVDSKKEWTEPMCDYCGKPTMHMGKVCFSCNQKNSY